MSSLTCALGPDSAGPLLAQVISEAKGTLTASFYEAGPSFVQAFVTASRAGAEVRLLLDRRTAGSRVAARELLAQGIDVRLGALPHAYIHWKVAVLGDDLFALGTGNLIATDAPQHPSTDNDALMTGTREWWVVAHGAARIAGALMQQINAAREHATALAVVDDGDEVEQRAAVGTPNVQVAPLDISVAEDRLELATTGSGVFAQLEQSLAQARHRIWITAPYIFGAGIRASALLQILRETKAEVRVLLGQAPHPSDLDLLRQHHLDVRVMNVTRSTRGHAKGLVADDAVTVSSANWSESGLSTNEEAALRIEDPQATEYFAACFARDWNAADA